MRHSQDTILYNMRNQGAENIIQQESALFCHQSVKKCHSRGLAQGAL